MIAFLLSLVLSATEQPPRESTLARTGTASLSGTVMTLEENSRPIGHAILTLSGAELRPNLVTIADAAGRFVFSGLPAGRFTVTASKPPYLTVSHGQAVAGTGSGVPISLQDGERIADVALKLPRGGVISGRVLDERGQPVRRSSIVIQERRIVNGAQTLTTVRMNQLPRTDGRGQYRVYGLPPGEYYVCAYPPGDWMVLDPSNVAATGEEVRQVGSTEMQWAMEQLRRAQRVGNLEAGPEPPQGRTLAHGIVYYPGTADPAAAVAVALGLGEEKGGIDVAMFRQPTARIEGKVIGPDGQPMTGVRISLAQLGGTLTVPSADGAISFAQLLPGRYTITAQATNSTTWASREIVLNGEDVTDLVLALQPNLTVSGRVAFEATDLTPPSDFSTVRLTLRPAAGVFTTVPVRSDSTFQVSTIVPGSYRLSASLPSSSAPPDPGVPRWTVKSAMLNGRDVADLPFDIQEDLSNIVITFTDRATELSGTVLDGQGRPAAGSYVVVFSTDKTFWVQGTRRLPAPVRAATDGTFRFSGLPPGAYYLAALSELDQSKLSDEAFLMQAATSALTVTLADGEKKPSVEARLAQR
jgi:hypothetical protein